MDSDSEGQGWHHSYPSASHPRLVASGGSLQVPAVPAPHPTEVMMTTGKDNFQGWCCQQPEADTSPGQGKVGQGGLPEIRPPQHARALQVSSWVCSQAQPMAFSNPSSLGAKD